MTKYKFDTTQIAQEAQGNEMKEKIDQSKRHSHTYNSIYRKGMNAELIQELIKKPEDMSPEQQAKVLGGIEDNISQQTSSTEDEEYTRPKDAKFTLDEEF